MAQSSIRPETFTRRLVAVLCIDAVDYSRRIGQADEETHIAVRDSIEYCRTRIADFGGRILDTTGDGFLSEFASAVRAVEAGVTLQREFPQIEATSLSDGRLEFRIGVTLGDVAFDTDQMFGSALNLAARIQAYSPPGELCVTRAVYEQVRGRLSVNCQSLGVHDIKGFEDQMELFRVCPDAEGAERTPRVRQTPTPLELPEQPSIAVLRLAYKGSEASEFEFLGDGISEDITTQLSRYKELFVIARNSAFAFDSEAGIRRVGAELGVRYILEGSVRTAGNRARISIKLVDAATERHIWGDKYDCDLSDIFDVQDQVSGTVVSTVAGRLADAERTRARKLAPMELKSYGWLLKGHDHLTACSRESNDMAKRCFKQSIELSPGFARAHAALSRAYHYEWQFEWGDDSASSLSRALDCANRAVELDREDPRGYAERGFVYIYMKELEQGISELRRAHQMNPNDADIMVELADALVFNDENEEAVDLIRCAMRVNPFYPDFYLWYLADACYNLRQYRDSISAVMKMHSPNMGRRLLAASYAQLGKQQMAGMQAEEVLRLQPDFRIAANAATQPDLNQSNADHFADGLRKAGLPE